MFIGAKKASCLARFRQFYQLLTQFEICLLKSMLADGLIRLCLLPLFIGASKRESLPGLLQAYPQHWWLHSKLNLDLALDLTDGD